MRTVNRGMKKISFFVPPATNTGEIIIRWNAHTEMPKTDAIPTQNHARGYFSPVLYARGMRSGDKRKAA